jgi:hypothetical protein
MAQVMVREGRDPYGDAVGAGGVGLAPGEATRPWTLRPQPGARGKL